MRVTNMSSVLRLLTGLFVLSLFVFFSAVAQDSDFIDNYQTWSLSDYEAAGNSIASFTEAPSLGRAGCSR